MRKTFTSVPWCHDELTDRGRVTRICVSRLAIIASSHYLKQCWNVVNWILRNKREWHFNRNYNIFIKENAFDSVVCEMAAMMSRPQCVNHNVLTSLLNYSCTGTCVSLLAQGNYNHELKCRSRTYLNLITTVPADALAPNGAMPSTGTMMTEKLYTLFYSFPC